MIVISIIHFINFKILSTFTVKHYQQSIGFLLHFFVIVVELCLLFIYAGLLSVPPGFSHGILFNSGLESNSSASNIGKTLFRKKYT